MTNPLLDPNAELPLFNAIQPEHIEPAIERILQENRQQLTALLANMDDDEPISWDTLMQPLDELNDRLSRSWSPVRHLNSVMSSDALRAAHDVCLSKITAYYTELGQDPELYKALQRLSKHSAALNDTQRKALDDALLGFHLSGIDLPNDQQNRFKAIQQELAQLQSRFEQNVLDATMAWKRFFPTSDALAGLPDSALAMLQQAAAEDTSDAEGWLINLQMPSYHAVITYADDRALREEIYRAYNTRASDQGPHAGQWDNSELIDQILRLRHEAANLLGYANYAEQSLVTKMAPSTDEVLRFLNDLADKARSRAEAEYAELAAFAADDLGDDKLQAWDMAYYSEKLRQQRYAISAEMLKPWFPADKVLDGLFEIVRRLYGIEVRPEQAEVWHPDVRFYAIYDHAGQLRGRFYLDLYARAHKRGGAWMDECVNRFRRLSGLQYPVAYLVCNLTPPTGDTPALFTHQEVETLFHEFGHGLHHMLTQIDYPGVSGINGVEWDAVELPSQFFENWCWEPEAIPLISGHYQTGEPLPSDMIEKLRAGRHFQAAMQLLRQLEFSLFDFYLHLNYTPERPVKPQALLESIRHDIAVVPTPDFVRFQNGFGHIFAGGYAAGYFSYKWAEVLSADAFAKFKDEGIFNPNTGRAFLQTILERGGSAKAMDLFVQFRGRRPTIDALLNHNGLTA